MFTQNPACFMVVVNAVKIELPVFQLFHIFLLGHRNRLYIFQCLCTTDIGTLPLGLELNKNLEMCAVVERAFPPQNINRCANHNVDTVECS